MYWSAISPCLPRTVTHWRGGFARAMATRHALARRIRAGDGHSSRIPAIALTAYGAPLKPQLALSAGLDEYVKKPFTPRALSEAVADVARRKSEPETPASPAGS